MAQRSRIVHLVASSKPRPVCHLFSSVNAALNYSGAFSGNVAMNSTSARCPVFLHRS